MRYAIPSRRGRYSGPVSLLPPRPPKQPSIGGSEATAAGPAGDRRRNDHGREPVDRPHRHLCGDRQRVQGGPRRPGGSCAGRRYVLTRPWLGATVPFTLTATDTQ